MGDRGTGKFDRWNIRNRVSQTEGARKKKNLWTDSNGLITERATVVGGGV